MRKIYFQKPGMAAEERVVLKAGLHTHTTNSDGKFTPEEIIEMYKNEGFDVLTFTDHRRTNKVSEYDGKGMTLISGIELHPVGPRNSPWHILAVGVPEDFQHTHPATGQEAVDRANEAGAAVFCAHPYWCGFTPDEVMTLNNILGIEVYNTSTRYIGKEINVQIWDELLDAGWLCPAIAVDDIHNLQDLGHGWTMILAEDKSPESLVKALKNGSYYSTQGPEFTRIELDGHMLHAEFSEVVSAVVVGRFASGCCETVPGQPFPGDVTPCRELTVDLRRCRTAGRIQLRDAAGRYAWSNPIPVPAE